MVTLQKEEETKQDNVYILRMIVTSGERRKNYFAGKT